MMSRWAFRFIMFYVVVLFTQPQNRFPWLFNLQIADISVFMAVACHGAACLKERRSIIRFGPGTVVAMLLAVVGLLSTYFGPLVTQPGWNITVDGLFKGAVVLVLVEASATNLQRVWAVHFIMACCTLWWVKAGLFLGVGGVTHSADRIMGPAVSLVANPNGFAMYMCATLPVYLYFYQQAERRLFRWGFLALAFIGVYIVLNTGSRTGLIILFAVSAFILPKYGRHHKKAIILAVPVIYFVVSLVAPGNIQRFKTIANSIRTFLDGSITEVTATDADEHSAQERHMKNVHSWELIKAYPVFGVGIGANQDLFSERFRYATGQVHNELLAAGVHMGFIGMALYLSMLGIIFNFGRRTMRRTRGWWPAISDLGWTYMVQAVVIAVGGFFGPNPWNPYTMILVGSASALWTHVKTLQPATLPAVEDEPGADFAFAPAPARA